MKKQRPYWTFETEEGDLLLEWCETTKYELLETKSSGYPYEYMKSWKPVKVQLVKVSK